MIVLTFFFTPIILIFHPKWMSEQGLNSALVRAFNHYKTNKETWQQLVKKDMNMDFSWESPASQYEELYEKSLARARSAAGP